MSRRTLLFCVQILLGVGVPLGVPSKFTATIAPTGRMTFDLGPSPDPQLVERARDLAASLEGPYVAEAGCLSAEDREAMAQRLAALLLRGGPS